MQDKSIASNDAGVEESSVFFCQLIYIEALENFTVRPVVLELMHPVKDDCTVQTVQKMIGG